jgi:translocation and assembly module TamB
VARRILIIGAAVIVLLVAVALAGLLVFTNTDYGRERVRRLAESAIQGAANHGVVRLGRVSGNLLQGFHIANVSIRDSAGAPFLVADSVSLNYGLRALLLKRLELTDIRLVRPLVVLDRPPGDSAQWNYKAIFRSDTPKALRDTTKRRFGDWIVLRDVTVLDGRMAIRSPWEPSSKYTGAERDTAIAEALGGRERVVVERRGDGFQKVVEFRQFNGEIPYLRLSHPDTKVRRLEIARLSMVALPFHPPAAVVNRLAGTLDFTGDSIWFTNVQASLPGSRAGGDGRYVFDTNEFDLLMRADPVSLADVRFIVPQVPARGAGTVDFRLRWRGDTATYIAQQANVRLDSARVGGEFAISLVGDSLWFHDTDVRFSSVDTHLIEQLFPAVNIPRHGTLSGETKLDGSPGLMRVDGNVAFDDARYGRSRVVAVGGVGTNGRGGVRFSDLDLTLDPVQVGLASIFAPTLPIGGTVRGTARLDGDSHNRLAVRTDLTHNDGGLRSRLAASGALRFGGRTWLDIEARALPLSLAEIGKFAPAVGLHGTAAGPVRVTGELGNLRVDARLVLADGGRLDARGTLDLASAQKGYDLAAQMRLFNARSVVGRAPATSLTATAFARGRGFEPATMRGVFGADLATSTIDTVAIDSAHVRAAVAEGMLQVDSATVSGPHTVVDLDGTFGLAAGRRGELRYRAAVDSLAVLNRFFPAADTSVVEPRPRGYSRIVAQARADSAAVARATEIERIATGAPAPRLGPVPPPPAPIRRDSTAGAVRAAGVIRGGIRDFDLRGRAAAEDVVFRGNSVRRARIEYAWLGARTPKSSIAAGASVDSVRAAGFAMDSLELRASYHASAGDVALAVYQGSGEEYSAGGNFVVHKDHNEVHLRELALRFDSTRWVATGPSAIRWGSNGIVIEKLELRDGRNGRVFADGNIPPDQPGGLDIVVENFQVADVAALIQSDLELRGLITTTARIEGTTRTPRFRAALGIASATYGGAPVPDLRATANYAAPSLTLHVEAADGGRRLAVADGTIAMNLGAGAGPLLPDAPITIDARSEGLPLDLVSRFTDAVEDVRGRAFGAVSIRGTTRNPEAVGALALLDGTVRLVPTGMRLTNVAASIRLLGDTVIIDSIAGRSGGRVFARGGLGIRTLSQPSFDLHLVAENARLLDDHRGTIRADVGVAVQGPFNRTNVTGRIGVRSGVIIVPESDHKEVLSARDPTLYEVIDTARVDETEEALVEQSALMSNLRMDVTVDVARDTWVRTNEANVEIYTPPERSLSIRVDQRRQALVLDGEVATDRGEYEFLSKRFQIRRGSAVFVGTSDPDPTLQITGEYEVRLAASEAIHIQVQIGGTLSRPKLSLSSDAQPPMSQSDLLSYLAFGRTSSSLLQFEGSSLSGGGSSNNLAGAGAQLATQQLAAVALGVFVNEFEGQAARSLGAAYVNVTPADLYSELAQSGEISGFFKGTEIELGKYTDANTFVSVQARLSTFASSPDDRAVPGVRLQRRFGKRFFFDASFTPRYVPQPSTLERVTPKSTAVFGAFLSREWRF